VPDITSGLGLSIPSDHPRILFNSGNLAAARAWYAAHPFSPRSDDPAGQALRGLLANDASSCAAAVSWAKGASSSIALSGTACDHCRWDGETIIQVYDWCYGTMSSADRGSLEASIDGWVDHWRTQAWGGPGMFENNYYWGYLRNEMEWGIARWGTNTSLATTQLDDALNARLGRDFYPATGAVGGVGQEGAQYGPYLLGYATVPFITAGQMGRDIFNESSYFLSGVYAYIYGSTASGQLFTWNDNDGYSPSSADNNYIANYMTAAAMRWRSAAVGGHARQWLNDIGGPADRSIQAVDDGTPAARDFSSLPLEYYAAGPRYLYGRSSWSNAATAYMLLLGAENGVGHEHEDYGSFQIWRGDSWLSRESVGYGYSGLNVAGLGGSGTNDVRTAIAHNTVAVGAALPTARGAPVVKRLESQPGYGFASVDLTSAFSGPHVERDFIFVRKLEALVVFDRGANVFLAHCETAPITSGNQATCTNGPQKLVVTSLVGNPALRVVTEGSQSGQRRIEISTSAVGGANTMLTVLQATDASASAILPTLTDNGASYTLRLGPTVSIDLVKGGTSSGGTITIDGAAHPLRANVQDMAVTPSGPVWR
jgi:hypothetical protein